MSIKLQLIFVACIIFTLASGRPDVVDGELDPIEDTELAELGREKRESCGWKYGCHKGYCWSNCKGGFGVLGKVNNKSNSLNLNRSNNSAHLTLLLVYDGDGPEWCYTTRGRSQDFQYVRCTKNSQCGKFLNKQNVQQIVKINEKFLFVQRWMLELCWILHSVNDDVDDDVIQKNIIVKCYM